MSEYKYEELSPQHFEWLELAEEVLKHNGALKPGIKRTANYRNGERYDDISREHQQLNKLHEADPEHFAEPKMELRKNGEVIGFYIEKIEGTHIQEYLRNNNDHEENLELIEEIDEAVQEMNKNGCVHGDLANNGIYNPETGELKFFDPVGAPKNQEDWEKMRKLDEEDLQRLRDNAYHPFADNFNPV